MLNLSRSTDLLTLQSQLDVVSDRNFNDIHPSIVYVYMILNFPQSWSFRNFGARAL